MNTNTVGNPYNIVVIQEHPIRGPPIAERALIAAIRSFYNEFQSYDINQIEMGASLRPEKSVTRLIWALNEISQRLKIIKENN